MKYTSSRAGAMAVRRDAFFIGPIAESFKCSNGTLRWQQMITNAR
jgi:hypothetical protein